MSCCGNRRAMLYGTARPAFDSAQSSTPLPARPAPPVPIIFEYQGTTELRALGPVTGRIYQFTGARSRVAVDARDAPSIAAVPKLRRVR